MPMALMDSVKKIAAKLNEVPFSGNRDQEMNLSNGGHTGFVPTQPQAQAVKPRKPGRIAEKLRRYLSDEEDEAPQVPQNPQAYDANAAQFNQSYDPNYVQQPAQQSQQVPQPQQGMYTAGGYQQQPVYNTGSQPMQPYATGGQQVMPGGSFANPQSRFNSAAPVQMSGPVRQSAAPQQAQQQAQPQQQPAGTFGSNVPQQPTNQPMAQPPQLATPLVPDGGRAFHGEDGVNYRHIEELATITRLADCYHLMEYMLDTRTVIVSMDMVSDARERTRCADLLFGAAYSLGCSLNRISMTNTYLISPRMVLVHASRNMDMLNQRDAAVLWPGSGINERGGYERDRANRSRQTA